MRSRVLSTLAIVGLIVASPGISSGHRLERQESRRFTRELNLPDGFRPAAVRRSELGRYFVVMKAPASSEAASPGKRAALTATRSQRGALAQAEADGARILFRYRVLVNGFSAQMSSRTAHELAARGDVASVEPVGIVRRHLASSVPFIGAPYVWNRLNVRGQGMRVAVVDTGIDYTHAAFGGSGDPADYEANDPTWIEPGTFPTAKVVGGFDFVGEDYDVLDGDPSNDIPVPDFDPLDEDGHGTHTASTCCGFVVPGEIGAGVAPRAVIYAYKVWDAGNSTDDVLVAAYERAVDPNNDGSTADRVDVLSFSGGVDYGTVNSVEAIAAQRVVDVGTMFVASAGNSGQQLFGSSAYIVGTPAVARGVLAVAASIDEFNAQVLEVNSPTVDLPDQGIMVHQDWSEPLPAGGITDDLFDAREVDPGSGPGGSVLPSDQQLCSPVAPGSFASVIPVIFKGSTGAGDCDGSLKVFNAQEAGAVAVVLQSGFGGFPFGLGPGASADQVTIPAVMISGADGDVLLDTMSPGAPGTYNTVTVNATLHDESSPVEGFADAMTDFSSEGPARLTSDLKPDISAPGFDIAAAGVGEGTGASILSGTSMAAPHVSGVATLMRQLHPRWGPKRIKSLLMNQAVRDMANNDLTTPVPATVMGAGRVDAREAARADSLATPGSLSFGVKQVAQSTGSMRSFVLRNMDRRAHRYRVSSVDNWLDYDPDAVHTLIRTRGSGPGLSKSFVIPPGRARRVWLQLEVDPSLISPPEQEYGWYYIHGNMDGAVRVVQKGRRGRGRDVLHVPWHVAPLAAASTGMSEAHLDLTGGPDTMQMTGGGAGHDHADLYLLGATDPVGSLGEEDVIAMGARSFTGSTIDGNPEGEPSEPDPLVGLTWLEFLTAADEPSEPVEFAFQTSVNHNIVDTMEFDVLVDAGADGVFADEELMADYLIASLPGALVCVFDLSLADPFDDCSALYFQDHSAYNAHTIGLVVDASAIGLSDGAPEVAYTGLACTGTFSGDVPGTRCDEIGDFDEGTGTWAQVLHTTDPALDIDPLVCGGFFTVNACDGGSPVTVDAGSAGTGDDPSILAIFPQNAPSRSPTVITTST